MFGQYAGFIIPSYAITALVIVALVIWTVLTDRARRREIAELEAAGARRRSDRSAEVNKETDSDG